MSHYPPENAKRHVNARFDRVVNMMALRKIFMRVDVNYNFLTMMWFYCNIFDNDVVYTMLLLKTERGKYVLCV